MTTQKTFKRRVRARSAKTGESYATARQQLVARADKRSAGDPDDPEGTVAGATPTPPSAPPETEAPRTEESNRAPEPSTERPSRGMSDDAVQRNTGHRWDEWFTILDEWGAAERRHPEIARWLQAEHGISGWWAQGVTVEYERRHGRARHQVADGYEVSVNRTIDAPVERLVEAFTDAALRERWIADPRLSPRVERAYKTPRFAWSDPASTVAVYVAPVGDRRGRVTVVHSRLPDTDAAERQKSFWRTALSELKHLLER